MSIELVEIITVVNKLGLHARASSKLVMLVAQHPKVVVSLQRGNDNWVEAANLVMLLMLGAGKGTVLKVKVVGDTELACQQAMQAVQSLFAACFDEQQ